MISKDVICPYCSEVHMYVSKYVSIQRSTLRCRHCHKKFRVTWMKDLVSTHTREDDKKRWEAWRETLSKEKG